MCTAGLLPLDSSRPSNRTTVRTTRLNRKPSNRPQLTRIRSARKGILKRAFPGFGWWRAGQRTIRIAGLLGQRITKPPCDKVTRGLALVSQ